MFKEEGKKCSYRRKLEKADIRYEVVWNKAYQYQDFLGGRKMSVIKQNISGINLFVYVLVSIFFHDSEELSIPLAILLIFTAVWFWWQIVKQRISFSFDVRNYSTEVKIIGFFWAFEVFLFVYNTFGTNDVNEIYNSCMLELLLCFLWIYVNKSKENVTGLFDSIIYAGIVAMGMMLFAYAGNEDEIAWVANLISNKALVASWALLFSIVGVLSYCFCEDKIKSLFYLLATMLSFLILCINHYCISFWLLSFVFLLIPIVFRPMAELIKRDIQMLFIFLFMLSNLSLVTNYTNFLLVDISLSLESSVYLEMLLAIGGVIFFTYWDRLPENVDLNKVSMLKLQRVFRYACFFMIFVFVGIIFGGNGWYEMPDTMTGKMIKSASVPILREVSQYRSGMSMLIEHQGIVGTTLFLVVVGMIFKKAIRNYHMDKQMVTSYLLIWILFVGQILFFMPSLNVIPVYFIFFLCSAYMNEKKKEVVIIKN